MADSQRIRFNNGQAELVMTREEFVSYASQLTDAARARLTFPEGQTYDSVYTNTQGELVRERISGKQATTRMAHGQSPIITGAEDEKLGAYNAQQSDKAREEVAEEEGVLTAFNAINPLRLMGLPQYLEDEVLGEETALRASEEIRAANPALDFGGKLAQAFAYGGAVGKLAKGLAPAGKTAALMGGEVVGGETAFYFNHIMENRLDFQAEDLMQNIVQGMMFAAPIFAGVALRRPAMALASGRSGMAQNFLAAGAISAKTPGMARQYARGAALAGIARRVTGGRKVMAGVDDVTKHADDMAREGQLIGRATPEGIGRAKGAKRAELLDAIKSNMDESATYLDDVDFDTMGANLTAARGSINTVRTQALNLNQHIGKGVLGVSRVGKAAQGRFVASMDILADKLDNAGYGDIGGHLKHLGGQKAHAVYGDLIQARLDARLKLRTTGGAAEASEMLRHVIEDASIWGKGKAAKSAPEINKAIDRLGDAYDKLDDLNIPKDLTTIPDGVKLDAVNDAINEVRGAYNTLRSLKLVKEAKVRAVEKALTQAEAKLLAGKKAYMDAGKTNKAFKSAAKNHAKKFEAITGNKVDSPEAIEGSIRARVAQFAKERGGLINAGRKVLLGEGIPKHMTRGVLALNEVQHADKVHLYKHLQEIIPTFTGSPEAFEEEMAPFITGTTEAEVGIQGAVGAGNTLFYLAALLPPVDNSLYGKDKEPSRAKVLGVAESFVACLDPMSVAYATLEGKATKRMIDAVRICNPIQYAELSADFSQLIAEADPIKTPRKVFASFNRFIGGADPLYQGRNIMQLQSNYAQNQQQDQAINGTAKGQFRDASNPQDPGNAFTHTQRVQSY